MKRHIALWVFIVMWCIATPNVILADTLQDSEGTSYKEVTGYGELTNLIITNYEKGIFETNYAITLHVDNAATLSQQQINDAFYTWIDDFYMAYQTSGELIAGYPAEYTTYFVDQHEDGENITYLNVFELNVDVPYEDIQAVWAFEDDIAAQIREVAATDLDKVLYVSDFVQRHYGYSYDTTVTPHSHVAFLKDGFGVCQAYALMTGELLERLGMNVKYVLGYITHEDGTVEQHAWNLVEVDGEWLNVDTTWSDPYYPVKGAASYNYMMSDSLIRYDHEREDTNLPQATEKKYEVLTSHYTMTHDERYVYAESKIGVIERFSKATMEKVEMPVYISGTNLWVNDVYLYYIDIDTSSLKRWNILTNNIEYLAPNVTAFHAENGVLVYERDEQQVMSTIQVVDEFAPSYKRLAFYWDEKIRALAGDHLTSDSVTAAEQTFNELPVQAKILTTEQLRFKELKRSAKVLARAKKQRIVWQGSTYIQQNQEIKVRVKKHIPAALRPYVDMQIVDEYGTIQQATLTYEGREVVVTPNVTLQDDKKYYLRITPNSGTAHKVPLVIR